MDNHLIYKSLFLFIYIAGKLKHSGGNIDIMQHQLQMQQQALAAASVIDAPISTLTNNITSVIYKFPILLFNSNSRRS